MKAKKRTLKHPAEPHPKFSGNTGHIGELHRDDTTRVWEDGKHCYIAVRGHRYKQTWTMDYDLNAVHNLITLIKNGNSVTAEGRSNKGDIKKLVYQCYYPRKEITGNVKTVNGDASDLSSANLYIIGDIVPATTTRRIWHDNLRIYIKLSCAGDLFYTDYDYLLYALLCDTHLRNWYILTKGNTKRLYCHNPEGTTPIAFTEIVWLYHKGELDPSNLIKSILTGKTRLAEDGLQIDHLRDNQYNNCIHNLAAMTIRENSQKNNLVTRINFPWVFIPVQKDWKYRVMCGVASNDKTLIKWIICDNTKALCDLIRQFWGVACKSGEMLPAPTEENLTNCASRTLEDSGREYNGEQYNIIEGLLQLSEEDFEVWSSDVLDVFSEEDKSE